MADFDVATPVKFINRQGLIVAGMVVRAISDTRASIVWWDPSTGLQTFAEGVQYSSEVPASSTFHLQSQDLTPKTDEEKVQFRLNAVESSGLENTTVAPGTGQTIQPIAGVPTEQQVTPTDGKAAEKAIDPMEIAPLTPVVLTDPPDQERTGVLTNNPEAGTVTPPPDPHSPEPATSDNKGGNATPRA